MDEDGLHLMEAVQPPSHMVLYNILILIYFPFKVIPIETQLIPHYPNQNLLQNKAR